VPDSDPSIDAGSSDPGVSPFDQRSPFDQLLELQGHDTALLQLHHRRSHLPEHTAFSEAQIEIDRLLVDTSATRKEHGQLSAKMQALEAQVHDLDVKIDGLNAQLFGTAATSPKELQALEVDIASVRKYRSELEDAELELIEAFEPHDAIVSQADARIATLRTQQEQLTVEIAAAQIAIDQQAGDRVATRASLAARIEPQLVLLYEKIRTANKGIAVARLEHGTCQACRLKIAAVELDRIRHLSADVLVQCDECSTILVR
jgi:uncharacterized protein